ncbi:MAG: permease [Tissierellales bacterium]
MAQTTIIFSIAAFLLMIVNSKKNGKQYEGLKAGLKQMIQTAPLILGAFILAGLIEVLIPEEFVRSWLSKEAGFKGIFLGTFAGMILAMGPYAAFPLASSILGSGAGIGTIVALVTGWCLLSLSKMPFETAFFGVKFFLSKLLISIPFAIFSGFIAHLLEIFIF